MWQTLIKFTGHSKFKTILSPATYISVQTIWRVSFRKCCIEKIKRKDVKHEITTNKIDEVKRKKFCLQDSADDIPKDALNAGVHENVRSNDLRGYDTIKACRWNLFRFSWVAHYRKYVKIRYKNKGSPFCFLSCRGQKIKNITKIEQNRLLLFAFLISFL